MSSYQALFNQSTGIFDVLQFTPNPSIGYVLACADNYGNSVWASLGSLSVTSITGTANQVLVNGTTGSPQTAAVTLTLPQSIATTSSPTFSNLTASSYAAAIGSMSAASFNFGSAGTGLYSAATTEIDITCGGTKQISITPSGVTIANNLTVAGSLTYISTTSFEVKDNFVEIGYGNPSDLLDLGMIFDYNQSTGSPVWAAFYRLAGTDNWELRDGITTKPVSTVGSTGTIANLIVNNITGTLTATSASQPNITTLAGLTSIQGQAIGAGVWGYVAAMNQSVATSASPSFAGITASANQFLGVVGTYITPTYSFSAHTHSGMYCDTSGNLFFTVNSNAILGIYGTYLSCAADILPANTNTNNLGNSTYKWLTCYAASVYATNLTGTIQTASQPNITGLGTLVSQLNVNLGTMGTAAQFYSGNTSNFCNVEIGRATGEFTLAVCAASGQFFSAAVAGDIAIRNENSTGHVFIGTTYNSSGNPFMVNQYGNLNVGTGGTDSASNTYGLYCNAAANFTSSLTNGGNYYNTAGLVKLNNTGGSNNANQIQFSDNTNTYTIQQINNGSSYLRMGRNGYSDFVIYSNGAVASTYNTLDDGSGNFYISRGSSFAYFANNNQSYPNTSVHGLAISWNATGGGGESDLYNTYIGPSGNSFSFVQMTGSNSATQVMAITPSGNVLAQGFLVSALGYSNTGTGNTAVFTSSGILKSLVSSRRYKKNISDMKIDAGLVYKLREVEFDLIDEDYHDFGVIAEEVHEVLPCLVNYNKEGLPQSVKYERLSVLLLAEIRNLSRRISALEERISL